jgi:hypothetical protein
MVFSFGLVYAITLLTSLTSASNLALLTYFSFLSILQAGNCALAEYPCEDEELACEIEVGV